MRSIVAILLLHLCFLGTTPASAQRSTVFEPPGRGSTERLLNETAEVRAMTEAQVLQLVPQQSGLNYVGCPNCKNGRQENQLTWSVSHPEKVTCQFCQHGYPSDKYPMTKSVKVQTPNHGTAEYPYWEDATGYRYFFAARRDDLARRFMADQANKLALLYRRSGDEAHARRAWLILNRFADVYPAWCFHYDYPFRQKEIVDGAIDPAKYRPGYRTARWTWWAYSDIPMDLIQAYDWLAGSLAVAELSKELNINVEAHIARDLFVPACQQVLDNEETYSNMSPTAWRSLAIAGRILKKPEYVHHVLRCMEQLVLKNFFYDGAWCEGSPDYESQTVGGLQNVMDALSGYEDPADYRDPVDGKNLGTISFALDPGKHNPLEQTLKTLGLALTSSRMLLPNGRAVPVHDTWPTSRRGKPKSNASRLWPALGHACLSATHPRDDLNVSNDLQLHLTWSGGYGHSHADNLSLLLYSRDREVLSDLGYTHTAYRAWTLASAAHNTVVVDGQNQALGNRSQPTDGRLIYSHLNDDRFNVVIADGSRGYPGLTKLYTRSVMMLTAPTLTPYIVDVFEVQGGQSHDYFLHGWADGPSRLTTAVATQPRGSLLATPSSWQPPKNEGQTSLIAQPYYAYGFLKNLSSASVASTQPITVNFQCAAQKDLSASTLRIHLFPEDHSELVLGENPSIRQAQENDAQLENFQRPFMMLRHQSSGSSRFLSVMEEFGDQSCIRSVENLSTEKGVVLKIQFEPSRAQPDRPTCQWILLDVDEPVDIQCLNTKLSFKGKSGFLSYNDQRIDRISCGGEASWRRDGQAWISSQEQQQTIASISEGELKLNGIQRVLAGSTVLIQTEDGWTYPITVQDCTQRGDHTYITSRELQAFEFDMDKRRLIGKMFPQREHTGKVTLRWFTQASSGEGN